MWIWVGKHLMCGCLDVGWLADFVIAMRADEFWYCTGGWGSCLREHGLSAAFKRPS